MQVAVNVCRCIENVRKWGHLSSHLSIEFEWKCEYANEVAHFPNVKTLSFSQGSCIRSFEMLEQLTSVEAVYAIGQHQLSDMSSLMEMPWLRRLWLSAVWQLDIAPLASMPFLQELRLGDARRGYKALAGLSGVICLELWGLRANSLAPLEELTNVEDLQVHSMPLRSLMGLPVNSPVRSLDTRDTTLRNLDGIERLPMLESLSVIGCKKLERISPLCQCVNLRHLYLNDVKCPIDLSSLLPCKSLETLYFFNANVTPESFLALRKFKSLHTCHFSRYPFQTDQDLDALIHEMPWCNFQVT